MREKKTPHHVLTNVATASNPSPTVCNSGLGLKSPSSASLMPAKGHYPSLASRRLLFELPADVLQSVLVNCLADDLCALECSCTFFKDEPERASHAVAAALTATENNWWPAGAALPGTGAHSWKQTLALMTAMVEGRRGCLGAGDGHVNATGSQIPHHLTVVLSKPPRPKSPDAPTHPAPHSIPPQPLPHLTPPHLAPDPPA